MPTTTFFLKPSPAQVARRALSHFAGIALQALAEWRRRRHARATFRALAQLDERMLRDLAIDRSELHSLAAAVAGRTQAQRERAGRWLLVQS